MIAQWLPADRLRQAEVDDLRDRLAVVALDQDVCRLQVAMDDALLMRMLHGRTDPAEKFQTLGQAQAVLVAVARERNALDQLHHEERSPAFGRPRIEELCDVPVVHERQRLPLRLKTAPARTWSPDPA